MMAQRGVEGLTCQPLNLMQACSRTPSLNSSSSIGEHEPAETPEELIVNATNPCLWTVQCVDCPGNEEHFGVLARLRRRRDGRWPSTIRVD